jgi:hypothetical protein
MSATIIQGTSGDRIAVQDQAFPIVCSTWVGSPSARVVEEYFLWLDGMLARAQREGSALVNITDGGLAGVPDADVRRLIAEKTKELDEGRAREGFRSITVIESPLIRGVMNALAWLHGDMKNDIVSSRREALEHAIAWLRTTGTTAPPDVLRALTPRPSSAR